MIAINQENKIYYFSSSLDIDLKVDNPFHSCVETFEMLSIDTTGKDDKKQNSIPFLEKVLQDLKHAHAHYGNCHHKSAEAWNALGLSRVHMQGDAAGARICHEHALAIFRDLEMTRDIATTLNDVGFCYERLDLHEEALQKYERALEIFVAEKLDENHPQVISTRRAISRMTRT